MDQLFNKNIEISGVVINNANIPPDEFIDKFINWIEEQGLSFGGGIIPLDGEGSDNLTEFENKLIAEVEKIKAGKVLESMGFLDDLIAKLYLIRSKPVITEEFLLHLVDIVSCFATEQGMYYSTDVRKDLIEKAKRSFLDGKIIPRPINSAHSFTEGSDIC